MKCSAEWTVQDPVIFSGSVRENLDPFGRSGGDASIWQALEQASIAPAIRDLQVNLAADGIAPLNRPVGCQHAS